MVAHTGYQYIVHHFEMLLKIGCRPVISSFIKNEVQNVAGTFDLVIQMGLGEKSEHLLGLEHVKWLRKRYAQTPILVISGHDPSYALEQVRRAGATDFLKRTVANEEEVFIYKVRELLGEI